MVLKTSSNHSPPSRSCRKSASCTHGLDQTGTSGRGCQPSVSNFFLWCPAETKTPTQSQSHFDQHQKIIHVGLSVFFLRALEGPRIYIASIGFLHQDDNTCAHANNGSPVGHIKKLTGGGGGGGGRLLFWWWSPPPPPPPTITTIAIY